MAAAVDSAVGGHGITPVMSYQAAAAIAAGKLTALLAQHEPRPSPVHLVLPSARSRTAKQRDFLSFAAPLLRRALLDVAAQIGDSRPDAR
jgi:DNA-binding transcriptional LysR family regulator